MPVTQDRIAGPVAWHYRFSKSGGFGHEKETDMALRYFSKTSVSVHPKAGQPTDHQVDYSYTQWRYAQMLQLERNYHAACDSADGAVVT